MKEVAPINDKYTVESDHVPHFVPCVHCTLHLVFYITYSKIPSNIYTSIHALLFKHKNTRGYS